MSDGHGAGAASGSSESESSLPEVVRAALAFAEAPLGDACSVSSGERHLEGEAEACGVAGSDEEAVWVAALGEALSADAADDPGTLAEPARRGRPSRGTSLEEARRMRPKSRVAGRRLPDAAVAAQRVRRVEAVHRGGRKHRTTGPPREDDDDEPATRPLCIFSCGRFANHPRHATCCVLCPGLHTPACARRQIHGSDLPRDPTAPAYEDVRYTRERSPDQDKRGRRLHVTWTNKLRWTPAVWVVQAAAVDLAAFLFEKECLVGSSGDACPTCRTGRLALQERGGDPCYRCSGGCRTFLRLSFRDEDLFPSRVPLRTQVPPPPRANSGHLCCAGTVRACTIRVGLSSELSSRTFARGLAPLPQQTRLVHARAHAPLPQVLLLWAYGHADAEPAVTEGAYVTGLHPKTVQQHFHTYRRLLAGFQQRANDQLRIGGWDSERDIPYEVEIDEICFRTKGIVREDGEAKVLVLRYFGLVRRGSSKVILIELPDAVVEAGGGGPISNASYTQPSWCRATRPPGSQSSACTTAPYSILTPLELTPTFLGHNPSWHQQPRMPLSMPGSRRIAARSGASLSVFGTSVGVGHRLCHPPTHPCPRSVSFPPHKGAKCGPPRINLKARN